MTARILLAEDEANYRAVLGMMLADLDVELVEAEDGQAALERLEQQEVDLVITDLNMPRLSGLELLERLNAEPHRPPVVVITAYGSIDSAVAAMRAGAIDYLEKPFDEDRLKLTVEKALRMTALLAENRRLRDELEERYDFSSIVGESPALLSALTVAGKVGRSESTVLVRGESGTGKELVARAVHFNSPRRAGPFIPVNCAAIPDGLLEAELFGARAGAYTGAVKARKGRVELARGGTLFLDEIGDLPLPLQAKLLRLLQEKTFTPLGAEKDEPADVRFVFATHRDLEVAVKQGTFREDLFYRVSVVPVVLPPLRERGDDVLLLAERFALKVAEGMGRPAPAFTDAARAALRSYRWPGNVRELANVVERAVILADDDRIDAEDLALGGSPSGLAAPPPAPPSSTTASGQGGIVLPAEGIALEEVERSLVVQALERTSGNKSQAARLLGLSRATLRYRIEKLGLG